MGQHRIDTDEKVLWQGRPAPRCYTFRLWKQALAGSALFLISSFWLMLALQLRGDGYPFWLVMLPIPLLLVSFILGPLQIPVARWRWAKIFYQLTETRIIFSNTRSVRLIDIEGLKTRKFGAQLASFRVENNQGKAIVLHCIEYPDMLLALLTQHCPNLKV
ncbi:hypothetical protein [Geopsychrobacter electrodiphilus]|uniref:hypothetical protein n=1 Tax=Geopsychrobacter electrodiphilus TaxID=225196 RepID=UPI0003718B9C|nr:hypothetical protein [Geopsychrobacter electrodiphilus]